jgi:hypothetical protein
MPVEIPTPVLIGSLVCCFLIYLWSEEEQATKV